MILKPVKIKNSDKKRTTIAIERSARIATKWIGSTKSLITHSILFVFFLILIIFGVKADSVMLVLTTIVSLEAIYLSIFIQMSVNHQASRLEAVSEDIEEIQEDVEEIQKDVEGIEKDIDEIQEDVEGIEEDMEEISDDMDEDDKNDEVRDKEMLSKIEDALNVIMKEIEILKKSQANSNVKSKNKTNTIKELTETANKKKK